MPEHHIKQVVKWLDPEYWAGFFGILSVFIYVGLGRMAHYVNIKKRLPKLKELFKDAFLIAFMGVVCSGALEFFQVQNIKVIGGASALFGYFGPRSIDIIFKLICKKFGYGFYRDICELEDIHEPHDPKK